MTGKPPRRISWAEHSGPALAQRLDRSTVVLCPIGAIEHHGPHLPLSTDTVIAESVTAEAARRAADDGIDVVVLPTIAYAKSDEHAWAPGTLWLSADTLLRTLDDLGRSLRSSPARRLVFVNGHGGNVALLQLAARDLRRAHGLDVFTTTAFAVGAATPPNGEGADERGLGVHGGAAETSLLLRLRPDLVDLSLAQRSVPEQLAEYRLIGFHGTPVTFGWLSNDISADGVVGDPTQATLAYGEEVFRASVEQLHAAIAEISRFVYPMDGS